MAWLGGSMLWRSFSRRPAADKSSGPPAASPLVMGALLAGVHSLQTVRIIDRITGTVLVGFGVKLALHPR